jgi:hypothetical protein
MRGALALSVNLLAAVLAVGCFEGKARLTFNPDGSGKIVGEFTFPIASPWVPARKAPGDELKTPEEETKDIVTSILKRSPGVDAWKDVSFERLPGDRIHFKGTAYFRELAKVRIFPDTRPRAGFAADGPDVLMLILTRAADEEEPSKIPRAMTGEEIVKALKQARDRYRRARPSLASSLTGLKFDLTFDSPGTPAEVHGLVQEQGLLTASVDGPRILKAVDGLFDDTAALREMIVRGDTINTRALSDLVRQRLFVSKGEAWAKMNGPFRVRFDYAAEVAAARKSLPEMMTKLGLDEAKPPAKPAPSKAAPPAKPAEPSKKPPPGSVPKDLPKVPPPTPLNIPLAPILPFS